MAPEAQMMEIEVKCGSMKKTVHSSQKNLLYSIRKAFQVSTHKSVEMKKYFPDKEAYEPVAWNKVQNGDVLKVTFPVIHVSNGAKKSTQIEKPVENSQNSDDYVSNLISKLKDNGMLTGQDRQYLVDVLKRKRENDDEDFAASNKKQRTTNCVNRKIQTEEIRSPRDVNELLTWMKQESKKNDSAKDHDNILKLMVITYPDRRSFIMTHNPKISAIKDTYPCLFSKRMFLIELDLLLPKCKDRFYNNITMYSQHILDMAPDSCELLGPINKAIKKADMKTREYVVSAGALLTLPYLLKEKPYFLDMKNSDFNRKYDSCLPMIKCSGSLAELLNSGANFQICAEEVELCKVKSFVDAFVIFFTTFFVFNIQYPPESTDTLSVAEILLFENEYEPTPLSSRAKDIIKLLKNKE